MSRRTRQPYRAPCFRRVSFPEASRRVPQASACGRGSTVISPGCVVGKGVARPMGMAIIHDVRLALRGFVARPGFAIVALATIALGIGANTAIFTVLRAVLLQEAPFPDAASLVAVGQSRERGVAGVVSYPDFVAWRPPVRTFPPLPPC